MWTAGSTLKRATSAEVDNPPTGSWAWIVGSLFETRIGPDYATNKKKAASAPALYQCFAVDTVSSEKKVSNIGKVVELPSYEEAVAIALEGEKPAKKDDKKEDTPLRKEWALPDFIIVNCQTPDYAPSNPMWGKKVDDGQGSALVFYYVLSPEIKSGLQTLTKLFPGGGSTPRLYTPPGPPQKSGLIGGMMSSMSSMLWSSSSSSASSASASSSSSSAVASGGAESDDLDLKGLKLDDSDLPAVDKEGNISGVPSKKETTPAPNSSSGPTAKCRVSDEVATIRAKIKELKLPINLGSVLLLNSYIETDASDEMKGRLKAIGKITNLPQVEINGAAKKLVSHYNGTPFLIRTTATFARGANYFEVDVDVHRFSYLARVGLYGIKEKLSSINFDFGFVIQGNDDEELPEQILGCARLTKLSLSQAININKLSASKAKK